jgi:amino acid transporter
MTERLLPGTAIDIEHGMRLKPGQIGFGAVMFQSLTHIAPALALIYALTVGVQYAGAAIPLSTVLGFIGVMAIAYSIGQLARVLPAAGYYMTWTGRSIDPRFGFMAGWFVLMSEAIPMGALFLILGTTMSAFLPHYAHFNPPYVIVAILACLLITALLYFGVKVSGTAGIVLGLIELGIMAVLAIWLIISAGSHNTLSVFTPSAPGVHNGMVGVLRAVIYTVPTFAGFETAAVLAEETRDPRRFVPRAILVATFGTGIFFVVGIYGGVVAWGPNKIASYASSSNAWQVLGTHVWGTLGAVLVFFALVNSILGNSNAEATAGTRLMYAMGRIGALPRWFGRVSDERHTPVNAIFFLMAISLVVAIGASIILGGPTQGFGFAISLGSIFAILLYMSACLSVPFLYMRFLRNEFNPIKHMVIPAIGILIFIGPLISTVYPVPPSPLNVVPYIDLAWVVIGLGVMFWLLRTRPESVTATGDVMLDAYTEEEEPGVVLGDPTPK